MTDKALASLDDRKLEWMQQETCQSRAHTLNHGGSNKRVWDIWVTPKGERRVKRKSPQSANKHKHKEAISTMTKEMRVMSFWGLQVHIFKSQSLPPSFLLVWVEEVVGATHSESPPPPEMMAKQAFFKVQNLISRRSSFPNHRLMAASLSFTLHLSLLFFNVVTVPVSTDCYASYWCRLVGSDRNVPVTAAGTNH